MCNKPERTGGSNMREDNREYRQTAEKSRENGWTEV